MNSSAHSWPRFDTIVEVNNFFCRIGLWFIIHFVRFQSTPSHVDQSLHKRRDRVSWWKVPKFPEPSNISLIGDGAEGPLSTPRSPCREAHLAPTPSPTCSPGNRAAHVSDPEVPREILELLLSRLPWDKFASW